MATIVYEGVGGRGDLFEGIKFFILQRVPSRSMWKDLIESNGGEVVKIDSLADYIIADHARKDSPAGSLSWRWIEACVKEGRLVDYEGLRAGPAEKTIREVASGQPTRRGRAPYTAEDDRILTEWVLKAERRGASIKGNEIYKQLELKNDRHTFQSWRDRWIKHLSHRPRPQLPDEDEDEDESSPEDAPAYVQSRRTVSRPSAPVPARNPQTQASSSRTEARQRPASPPVRKPKTGKPFVAKSKGGTHFTESEEQSLIDVYDDVLALDEDMTIDAWSAWAKDYPNHTAQEWRNHFMKHIAPRMEQEGQDDEAKDKKVKVKVEEPTLPAMVHRASASRQKSAPSNLEKSKVTEIKDSQGSSGRTLDSQNAPKSNPDPALVDESLFEAKMRELADKLELELDLIPVICGKKLALFRLWQVVMSDKFGGFDEVNGRGLWPRVAKELDFNDFKHKGAAQDLRDCYSELLIDFEELRDAYREENPDLTDSQEADTSQLIENQLMETATREAQNYELDLINEEGDEDDDEDDDLDQPPSSAPRHISTPSGKRSFDSDRVNNGASYNKRQRIEKGKGKEVEIPSTPEEVLNGTQAPRRPHGPSLLKRSAVLETELNLVSDDEDDASNNPLFVRSSHQPGPSRPPPKSQRILEPETQDFHFPPEPGHPSTYISLSSSPNPQSKSPPRPRVTSAEESTQSQTESERKAEELQAFFDRFISLGYQEDIIAEALEATTMETGEAPHVMEHLTQGHGIPEDVEGVWTSWDNDALGAGEGSEEFERIVRKHGLRRVEMRRRFLEDAREFEKGD